MFYIKHMMIRIFLVAAMVAITTTLFVMPVSAAESRTLCTKDGQCAVYVPVPECQADPFFKPNCMTMPIGSDVPTISPDGCSEYLDLKCFQWIPKDCAETYPNCE